MNYVYFRNQWFSILFGTVLFRGDRKKSVKLLWCVILLNFTLFLPFISSRLHQELLPYKIIVHQV